MKIPPKRSRVFKGYKNTSRRERLDIIYEFKIHKKSVLALSSQYNINYNTVRNILQAYYDMGRTRTKKYKRVNIPKKKRPSVRVNLSKELFIEKGPIRIQMSEQQTKCPLMLMYGEQVTKNLDH